MCMHVSSIYSTKHQNRWASEWTKSYKSSNNDNNNNNKYKFIYIFFSALECEIVYAVSRLLRIKIMHRRECIARASASIRYKQKQRKLSNFQLYVRMCFCVCACIYMCTHEWTIWFVFAAYTCTESFVQQYVLTKPARIWFDVIWCDEMLRCTNETHNTTHIHTNAYNER